jgi:hypothetical protein
MNGDGTAGRRIAIVVSGMHRSGTSAITRVVSLLGAALPNQLIEGDHRNERGFWEGRAVVNMNKLVLDRFGAWGGGWESIDPEELLSLTRIVERTRKLVRNEFGAADLIVLKDPRVCRLLPLWTHALEQEGFRCVHILALRHPGAVADSRTRRDELSPKATTLSWLAHSLDAEFHTRAQPRVVMSFENVLRNWRAEFVRAGRALGVEWPRSTDDVADAVAEFIEPSLAHKPPPSALRGPVTAAAPVYGVLQRWSEDDARPEDAGVLDSWRALLEPIRGVRSSAARMSIERKEMIAELKTRKRRIGPLGSAPVWGPMRTQAHNIEADAAWAWLQRERQHRRAARRAAEEAVSLAQQGRFQDAEPRLRAALANPGDERGEHLLVAEAVDRLPKAVAECRPDRDHHLCRGVTGLRLPSLD